MQTSALTYFAFALGWSFAFWGVLIAASPDGDPLDSPFFVVGGAGPIVAAVALTHLRESPATRRDFWLRVVDPRRLRWPWWAVALLLHPLLVALAFAADVLLGGAPPSLQARFASIPALLSFVFFVFWFGPLPEEIGWRGFALDRLQSRMPALQASLLLGAIWALWHVPLFWIPGTYQSGLALGSTRSWIFLASMVPLSVLMTWIYNNTARSTLSAVLVHFSGNLIGALFVKTDRAAALELAFLSLAATLVTWVGGAGRPTRR